MRPSSGRSKPAISRSVVVLPEPDGPSSVKNSPAGISRSTRSTATTSPYVLRMPASRTSISAAGMECAAGSDSASAGVAKRFLQQVEPALEQRVVDREGNENANDVSVDTAREEDEAAVTRCGRHRLGEVGRRLDELEGEHGAEAPHLADGRVPGCELLEASPDPGAQLLGPLPECVALHLAEHLDRRDAREWVAAECPAEPTGRDAVDQLGTAGDSGERKSAAERLARDDQVRFDAVVLDRPHRAGPADTGLDLVVDEEDPVLLADLLQPLREVFGHLDEATLALHGRQHEAGDRGGVDVLLEQQLEPADRVVRRDTAVRVRRRRAIDLARERTEALLVRDDLRRHRHRQAGAAVERVIEDDHSGPPGRSARNLDGVLDRFGAGVHEERLRLTVAGPRLVEQLAHLDVRLVHPDHEALMQITVDLLADRRRREAVAGVLAAEAAREVDVLAAVDVPDACAFGTSDDERGRGHAAGDIALAVGDDPFGCCGLVNGHQACFRSPRISSTTRSPVSTAPFR